MCVLVSDSTMATIRFHLLFWKPYEIAKYSHFYFYISDKMLNGEVPTLAFSGLFSIF